MKVIYLKKFVSVLVAISLLATCIFTVTAATADTVKKYSFLVFQERFYLVFPIVRIEN